MEKLKTAKARGKLWEVWDLLTFPSATTPKRSSTNSSGWRSPEKLKTAKARGKLWELWELLTFTRATTPKRSSTFSRGWRTREKLKTAKARGRHWGRRGGLTGPLAYPH